MDPATAAVMVLLLCSPGDASICKPVNTASSRVFASLSECRTSLAEELARAPSGRMIGRCQVVDPIVTGSVPAGYTTVMVTRGGSAVRYIVPHKE
ncbi:hypothetical protein EN836_04915 [Mesorhizobium sp. M1C.F.Ca.ET.193.01.1.1]|nr:MAG: hypothetical protein EOQ28_04255 [Mesorhizobium sp.]TGQ56112.1 hypothetical protein EN853_04910 [Mesorhizobium sp. M1C.F.Ca.ET.210.01.1.1]TGQ75372.1 hypothetical protein EN855_004920 [Mesorhizobium sp. M1C.F.Ca.ET.212.01.1.1]TGR13609.1 hypothetical protein EN847_04915 [Mesorhizobium sp. M1C.F.Ca.ET.204.01.1.1]TGR34061.1 hypothetical protein EN839_04915 [Mesorhizobium sp. M1C.F.Ca.ET.196.01.1.1]TGR56789.1 hypothetical protein EN838_04920 [Mesorhizobium sp. M1C.F.Ca.ET.195.01.1.1]TGR690